MKNFIAYTAISAAAAIAIYLAGAFISLDWAWLANERPSARFLALGVWLSATLFVSVWYREVSQR